MKLKIKFNIKEQSKKQHILQYNYLLLFFFTPVKRLELLNNNAKFSPVIKMYIMVYLIIIKKKNSIYLHQIIGHDKAMVIYY